MAHYKETLMKVEEKKRAFEEWLQCNSVEKYGRYREKNVEAKRKVEEAKRMSKVTERQKLNVFEMKCLRSMTGVSRLDRVRNEVVRARTGVRRELAARVDVNILRWFGHVERMDNERLLKKVMNAKVDGRSARGRPRFGWMDGVKRALNDGRMDIR